MSKKPAAKSSKTIAATKQASITPSYSAKRSPADWEKQVSQIVDGMRQSQLNLGEERTADILQQRVDEVRQLDREINIMETKLAEMRDIRNEKKLDTWQLASSIRTTVAGTYGKDSLQYQALGGIRQSERKPTKSKTKS